MDFQDGFLVGRDFQADHRGCGGHVAQFAVLAVELHFRLVGDDKFLVVFFLVRRRRRGRFVRDDFGVLGGGSLPTGGNRFAAKGSPSQPAGSRKRPQTSLSSGSLQFPPTGSTGSTPPTSAGAAPSLAQNHEEESASPKDAFRAIRAADPFATDVPSPAVGVRRCISRCTIIRFNDFSRQPTFPGWPRPARFRARDAVDEAKSGRAVNIPATGIAGALARWRERGNEGSLASLREGAGRPYHRARPLDVPRSRRCTTQAAPCSDSTASPNRTTASRYCTLPTSHCRPVHDRADRPERLRQVHPAPPHGRPHPTGRRRRRLRRRRNDARRRRQLRRAHRLRRAGRRPFSALDRPRQRHPAGPPSRLDSRPRPRPSGGTDGTRASGRPSRPLSRANVRRTAAARQPDAAP